MQPGTDPGAGAFDATARVADRLRWFFLPLALCALVAVGVHTAADVLGELLLRMVDAADAAFDSLASRWAFTAPLVDLVGPSQRVFFARLKRDDFDFGEERLTESREHRQPAESGRVRHR